MDKIKIIHNYLAHLDKCFILGNGPTLNKFKIEDVKKYFTIGCNKILLSGFEPHLLVISDPAIIDNKLYTLLEKTKSMIIVSCSVYNKLYTMGFNVKKIAKKVDIIVPRNRRFSFEYEKIWHGDFDKTDCLHSVLGDLAIPAAIYLGIKKLYLLGVDEYWNIFNITDKHFYDYDNEKNVFRWAAYCRLRNIWYAKLDLLARQQGANIYNMSPGSAICSFNKIDPHNDFKHLINDTPLNLINKYIYINNTIYKVIPANNKSTIQYSFKNILTKKFLRHKDGIIIESDQYDNPSTFSCDSSFYIEQSFTRQEKVSLRCSNIENFYVVKHIYLDRLCIGPMNSDFIASESSFEVFDEY